MDSTAFLSDLNALKNTDRFFRTDRGGTTCVYDSLLNDFFALSAETAALLSSSSETEAGERLRRAPSGVLEDDAPLIRNILSAPEEPLPSLERPDAMTCLQLSTGTTCNLSCKYCFRDREPKVMQDETIAVRALHDLVYRYGPEAGAYTVCFSLTSEPFLSLPLLEALGNPVCR